MPNNSPTNSPSSNALLNVRATDRKWNAPIGRVSTSAPAEADGELMWAMTGLTNSLNAAGHGRLSRLYLHMRHVDDADAGAGHGCVSKSQLVASYREHGHSRKTLQRDIRDGAGKILDTTRERVYYYRPARIITALGLEFTAVRDVKMRADELLGTMPQHNAAVYQSYLGARVDEQQGVAVARETLYTITGVSPSAQREYEDTAVGLTVTPNFGVLGDYDGTWRGEDYAHGELMSRSFIFTDYKGIHGAIGKSYVVAQLANTYTIENRETGLRRSRRMRNSLPASNASSVGNRDRKHTKLFYHDGQGSPAEPGHPLFVSIRTRAGTKASSSLWSVV